jgi:hypothetical protein
MIAPSRNTVLALSLAAATGLCSQSDAAVLMLDFGGTTVAAPDRTNSPYHSVDGAFTDSTWSAQGLANDSSHVWSDGSAATGVAVNLFKGNAGSTTLASGGWSSSSASLNGSDVNTGVYADTSVGRDGSMMTNTFTDHRSIGVQVVGLASGEYDVYLTGRNTNYIVDEHTVNFYAAAASTAGGFNFGSYASESTTFAASATDKVSAWQFTPGNASANNYVKLTVTLSEANPYLNIGSIGSGTNGIFSSIQVVAVPEPASLGLVAAMGLIARRRRA